MRPLLRTNRKLIVEPIGLLADDLTAPIDGRHLFGNDNPLELEIGSGKGTFLTDQAKARPQTNFVGLEKAHRYWRYASDRLRRHGCINTRMVLADAAPFVTELLTSTCLTAVHIYFPDPWPKKRHHKRRLIQGPFLEQVERVLLPRGVLQVVTDHEDYFQQIERVLRDSNLELTPFRPPGIEENEELVGSNFERKYRREGRPFYSLAAAKSSK
jgi:tRNA (guanine-N7-)-methyltransferase